MNDFRSRILTGKAADTGLLTAKSPRNKATAGLDLRSVSVARTAPRTADHRTGDRHRLVEDRGVTARFKRKKHQVSLINLSGGGAMIEAPFIPKLWDRIELDLGSGEMSGKVECAVRWLKNGRIGLEFAHETRIDADVETKAELLNDVLATSFPDVGLELATADDLPESDTPDEQEVGDQSRRTDVRHPLIWMGSVHFDHDTTPVRLRNISASGALVEGGPAFVVGAELLLDLDEAGSHFATVSWIRGDQAGLAFRSPFDVATLAKSRPQLAPSRWSKPTYLRDENRDSSPWASEWGRLSLSDLHKTLGRR
jgi:hypothetical protein